ncbi:hypothetical protein E4U82_10975 [Lentibacillus salicampi]|uniref:Uncharacterized protein n=1 Tax=Lentibacillus salicampi TaxID=175306 RepID=A0A4Y9AA12_9BACI|nr:hypothetical protein E4U82_10975 [Lentibacillus salicampi]
MCEGQEFVCIDSLPVHNFSFTPSFSIFMTCDSEEELNHKATIHICPLSHNSIGPVHTPVLNQINFAGWAFNCA